MAIRHMHSRSAVLSSLVPFISGENASNTSTKEKEGENTKYHATTFRNLEQRNVRLRNNLLGEMAHQRGLKNTAEADKTKNKKQGGESGAAFDLMSRHQQNPRHFGSRDRILKTSWRVPSTRRSVRSLSSGGNSLAPKEAKAASRGRQHLR